MLVRSYVQRQRMEAPLRFVDAPAPPAGVELLPWTTALLEDHADVKWRSFRHTDDAIVFPNLGRRETCVELMQSIAAHAGFLPGATWLARGPDGPCGCIQGVCTSAHAGMIQNLAVLAEYRGRGVGKALLAASMYGFLLAGLEAVQLEVSVRNQRALRLYRSAGFALRRTFYRETKSEFTEYAI